MTSASPFGSPIASPRSADDPVKTRLSQASLRSSTAVSEEKGLMVLVTDTPPSAPSAHPLISNRRKWSLLAVFCLAQYLDICGRSALFIFVNDIARDLKINYETSTWILNSYGVTFGSVLLLWGRISDLYSAKLVFTLGFVGCGLFNLGISFVTDEYAFYVLRGLYGVSAAATIPSAFRMILGIFDPKELQQALAYFGLSAALANATGLLWGGLFGTISLTGQMEGWRWYCRFVTVISIPFALLAHFLAPSLSGPNANTPRKWRHLDVVGCTLILGALLLLNIGLTEGASKGWKKASFYIPFALSWPVALVFFLWEMKMPQEMALLPTTVWKVRNMKLMCFAGLFLFTGIAMSQLPLVERYEGVFGESAIIAALRLFPQGVAMCLIIILAAPIMKKVKNMRFPLAVGFFIVAASFIPMIYGEGRIGTNYWKYYFPTFAIGAMGSAAIFLGVNIAIMTSVPPTMAGVAGALFQSCCQTGVAIAFSVQAGLLTIHDGSVSNFENVKIAFWFQFGWGALLGLLVLVLFRRPKAKASEVKEVVNTPTNETANMPTNETA